MNPQDAATPLGTADENAMGGGGTEARSALAQTKEKVTKTARDAAAKVKSAASDTAAKARDQVERVVTEKKETTAARLGDYSSAIHESARALEEKDPNIAWFTHRAADKLQSMSDYVRSRDFNGLREDAERLARRHPAVFFGGMFLGGLLIGNLVKASRRKLDDSPARERDDSDGESGASEAGADWMSAAQADTEAQRELPISTPGAEV